MTLSPRDTAAQCAPTYPPIIEGSTAAGPRLVELRWRQVQAEACAPTRWEIAIGDPPTLSVFAVGWTAVIPADDVTAGIVIVRMRGWREQTPGPWSTPTGLAAPPCLEAPLSPLMDVAYDAVARAVTVRWAPAPSGCRPHRWTLTLRSGGDTRYIRDFTRHDPRLEDGLITVVAADLVAGVGATELTLAGATDHAWSEPAVATLDPCTMRRAAPSTLQVQSGRTIQWRWHPAEDLACQPVLGLRLRVDGAGEIVVPAAGDGARVEAPPGVYTVRAAFVTAAGVGFDGPPTLVVVP